MRIARETVPGVVYHLISRFVDREWFIHSDEERELYLRLLASALSESDWRCLAYALMSNHIHLAMVAGRVPLGSWIRRVHSPFASWMNTRHDRIGSVFVRGPKDYAVRAENEGKLIAYIHNNPVAAGVASRARHSSWTSHRAYVGDVRRHDWLCVDEGLARSGFESRSQFDAWIDATPGESGEVELDAVRREVRKRGAIEIATPMAGDVPVVPLLARRWGHIRIDPRLLVSVTADVLGISELVLCSRRRNPTVLQGRRVVIHAGRILGLSGADSAAALGITQQAASVIGARELEPLEVAALERVLRRMRHELDGTAATLISRLK